MDKVLTMMSEWWLGAQFLFFLIVLLALVGVLHSLMKLVAIICRGYPPPDKCDEICNDEDE